MKMILLVKPIIVAITHHNNLIQNVMVNIATQHLVTHLNMENAAVQKILAWPTPASAMHAVGKISKELFIKIPLPVGEVPASIVRSSII